MKAVLQYDYSYDTSTVFKLLGSNDIIILKTWTTVDGNTRIKIRITDRKELNLLLLTLNQAIPHGVKLIKTYEGYSWIDKLFKRDKEE